MAEKRNEHKSALAWSFTLLRASHSLHIFFPLSLIAFSPIPRCFCCRLRLWACYGVTT